MIAHWNLKPGDRVLDIGCAKGFLVKDFMLALPGLEAFGIDISRYAAMHCEPEVVGRIHVGDIHDELPFPDHSFDAVVCLNTLHNLKRPDLIRALREIERVTRDSRAYVQVDSYRSEDERELFLDWVLTAYTHDYPAGWKAIFAEAGYQGRLLLDAYSAGRYGGEMTALAAKDANDAAKQRNAFDVAAARARCKRHRKRILEMTQSVSALHVGGAFSSTEIVDCIYYGLMRPGANGVVGKDAPDTFLMSKGHGYMIQAVILEDLGVLKRSDLAAYCTPTGKLGVHPDYGIPGIEASTGSLGHGLSLALGMAYAEMTRNRIGNVYTVLSDGEVQEGSTWEATLMASSLKVRNLVAFIDNNDMQSLGFTHVTHPSFYPVVDKFRAFGWECVEVDGHDSLGDL